MDDVSRLLAEREGRRPRLVPWVAVAVLLHAGVASAVWIASQTGSPRHATLPAVSVRFVRPDPPRRTRQPSGGPERRATPVPEPTAAPTAPPTAAPESEQQPEPAATAPPSADAMSALDSTVTPAPSPPPAPPGGGGSGLSLGGGDRGNEAVGVPSDFQFTYYLQRMLALIESRWYKPPVPRGTKARVRFTILSSGRVEAIQLEVSSGAPAFDRAALRALYAANPLPPLPPAYRKPSLTVHLSFSE